MKLLKVTQRWISALMIAAIAATTISPAAWAGGKRRYKGAPAYCPPPVVQHTYYPRRSAAIVRHSDAAPLFAGLIGGFVLGSAIASSRAPDHYVRTYYEPGPAHFYWDPYCRERFASLAVYRSHFHRNHHPRVVRVISVRSGACLDTYRWHDGDWRSWDDDWDDDRDRDWDDNRDGDWDD